MASAMGISGVRLQVVAPLPRARNRRAFGPAVRPRSSPGQTPPEVEVRICRLQEDGEAKAPIVWVGGSACRPPRSTGVPSGATSSC